jgi:hypothetical protein
MLEEVFYLTVLVGDQDMAVDFYTTSLAPEPVIVDTFSVRQQ